MPSAKKEEECVPFSSQLRLRFTHPYFSLQLQQKHEEMVFPALRSEPRPDIWIQDPVQQPSGTDGHIETSQPDHTEGRKTKR